VAFLLLVASEALVLQEEHFEIPHIDISAEGILQPQKQAHVLQRQEIWNPC